MPSDPRCACLYLHGFASSPRSFKASSLQARFEAAGLSLSVPDLNAPDFTRLTLSRQIQQAEALILHTYEQHQRPTVVIGSSLGGLTAAWLAERPALKGKLAQLVLLAPAFEFLAQWLPKLGAAALQQWQQTGSLQVYHYGENRSLPLHYGFVLDAQQYDEQRLQRPVPSLILHGQADQVIEIAASRRYAASRPWVELVELASDHGLANVQSEIWQAIEPLLARLC